MPPTEDPSTQTIGCHAQVVPSFIVPLLPRTLTGPRGPFAPEALLAWPGDEPSEATRQMLLAQIVRRVRPRAAQMWPLAVNVRLSDDWPQRLHLHERQRMQALLRKHPPQTLQALTLRQVKTALGLPLAQTLSILARLEAMGGPIRISVQKEKRASADTPKLVNVTPQLQAQAEAALQLAWAHELDCEDVRFAYRGPEPFAQWVRAQLAQRTVPASLPILLDRVIQADKLTAAQEVAQIVHALVSAAQSGHTLPDMPERWTQILLARYLSDSGFGRTLAATGQLFGLTRERVRQICSKFEHLLPAGPTATPALERVLAATARITPCAPQTVNEQLARFIGEGAGIEALLNWARLLGKDTGTVRMDRATVRVRGHPARMEMVERGADESWLVAAVRHASRDCSVVGCSNTVRVAGLLALQEGVSPGSEALEAALCSVGEFRWLDEKLKWFTLGDTDTCTLSNRVRKVMAVTEAHLGVDEIAQSLVGDDRWLHPDRQDLPGLAIPPAHVLRDLFRGWRWLKTVQSSRFEAAQSIEPDTVLSQAELAAVGVLRSHGGIAGRVELAHAVFEVTRISRHGVDAMLASSPIFERVEKGLYKLRGCAVSESALPLARYRSRLRRDEFFADAAHEPVANGFILRVSEAALRNEQYSVPAHLHKQLAGREWEARDSNGAPLGTVRISATGVLRRLNRLFPGLAAGSHLRVALLPDALEVGLLGPHSSQPTHGIESAAAAGKRGLDDEQVDFALEG